MRYKGVYRSLEEKQKEGKKEARSRHVRQKVEDRKRKELDETRIVIRGGEQRDMLFSPGARTTLDLSVPSSSLSLSLLPPPASRRGLTTSRGARMTHASPRAFSRCCLTLASSVRSRARGFRRSLSIDCHYRCTRADTRNVGSIKCCTYCVMYERHSYACRKRLLRTSFGV